MHLRQGAAGLGTLKTSLLLITAAFLPAIANALPTPGLGGSGGSGGEEQTEIDKKNLEVFKVIASGRVPLQGGNFIDLPSAYSNQNMNQAPAPASSQGIPKLPAMRGFAQIADSNDYKKMLRQLISAEIPVMYQTMMMVENGAATGFMGSMNTVSNIVSNLVETQDLQLNLFDAVESSNSHKRAYVDSMYKSQSEQNKDFWPAALMFAAGDKFPEAQGTPPPNFTPNPSQIGSSPIQRVATGTGAGTGAGGTPGGGNNAQQNEYKLSEVIFSGSSQEARNYREDFTKWVGDYKVKQESATETVQDIIREIIPPTEAGRMVPTGQTITTPGGNQQSEVNLNASAYTYKLFITTLDVWKNLNANIYNYCQFKKENPNKGKQIFEKKRPSSSINSKEWAKIQSLDINVSLNLIDQYFKLILGRRSFEEIDCEQFKNPPLPREESISEDNGSFDSCGSNGGGARGCLSKFVLLRIAEFIATSKTNYFYREMWLRSLLQATVGESMFREVSIVFCTNLGLGIEAMGNEQAICDPQSAFDQALEENRQLWLDFLDTFSRLAQGVVSGAGFKPGSNNVSNFRPDNTR